MVGTRGEIYALAGRNARLFIYSKATDCDFVLELDCACFCNDVVLRLSVEEMELWRPAKKVYLKYFATQSRKVLYQN